MKKLKHLGFSGAGFAIPGIAGAGYQVLKDGFKPDIVSGVSSGSILTFLVCASKNPLRDIKDNSIGFKANQVFKHPPFSKKGKIRLRSIWNAVTKNYLSKQDKLDDLLRSIITEKDWKNYLNNDEAPEGVIMSVDLLSGSRIFSKLKELSYEEAITNVVASASIPVFVNPVEDKDYLLADGGVRNHILTEWILDEYNLSETISIFARPEDFKKPVTKKELKGTFKVLERTIEIMQFEISKSDEQLAKLKCSEKNVDYKSIYIKNILNNVYEESKDKQIELFFNGVEKAKKIIFKGVEEAKKII